MKITATIFLLTGVLFAQNLIQDTSAAGSPLSFADTKAANNIVARNLSTREILAYVIDFNNRLGFQHDFYFKPDGIKPNTIQNIGEWPSDVPQPPTLHAKVIYVQFVDGTEWGDRAAGDKLLQSRQPALQFIAQVIDANSKGGEAAFVTLLNSAKQDNQPSDAVWGLAQRFSDIRARNGMAGAMQHIQSRVASAAKHDKTLHP